LHERIAELEGETQKLYKHLRSKKKALANRESQLAKVQFQLRRVENEVRFLREENHPLEHQIENGNEIQSNLELALEFSRGLPDQDDKI
jgi:chromosome segregation ATPase